VTALDDLLAAARRVATEGADGDLSDCPYFLRGRPGADPNGTCSYGCHDEPNCQTCIPRDGWPIDSLRHALDTYDAEVRP
jgi:hypothetical protein